MVKPSAVEALAELASGVSAVVEQIASLSPSFVAPVVTTVGGDIASVVSGAPTIEGVSRLGVSGCSTIGPSVTSAFSEHQTGSGAYCSSPVTTALLMPSGSAASTARETRKWLWLRATSPPTSRPPVLASLPQRSALQPPPQS